MPQEIELEIFRVGGSASRHIKPEHIAEVATHEFGDNPAPICFGHPKSDTPAAGTISALRADGNSLFAKVKGFTDEALDGIKSGAWINRSAAFFDPNHEANPRPGKWSFRHLGLLGGAAPGIPGMGSLQKALAFDAAEDTVTVDGDPADAVVYAGKPTNVIFVSTEEHSTVADLTPEQIAQRDNDFAAREKTLADREKAAAERVRNAFTASNNRAIDALVLETKVLPAEAEALKTAFAALDPEGEELTFGAGDKATKSTAAAAILSFMAGLPKRVPIGDRSSPTIQFQAADEIEGDTYSAKAETLDARARKLMEDTPGLSFEAAIERASGGGNVA